MRTIFVFISCFFICFPVYSQETSSSSSHHYQLIPIPENSNWGQADNLATSMGGYLATITTQEESDRVSGILSAANSDYCFLGGMHIYPEGPWEWVTGEAFDFENWSVNEPEYLDSYMYTTSASGGNWYSGDGVCGANSHFLLEIDSCLAGDVNGNGSVNIGDAIYLYEYLNDPGPAPILVNSDINGDCYIDNTDVVYFLNIIFRGGPQPVGCMCDNPEVVFSTMAVCLSDGNCTDISEIISLAIF
ncbi:MAG: lectin-like protein [Candidatus Zixiibacteriota bacterium]